MALRSKKRHLSERSYETKTPNPKQRHLASPGRVTKRIKPKTPATISTSKKKQDTLTQRGFDLHLPPEDVDLDYSEDFDGAHEENLPKRKRKTMTQTLTQGGFVFRQDPEELDLVYEGEPDVLNRGTPSRRKRRKVLPKEPVMRVTRSASKRMVERDVKFEEDRRGNRKPEVKSEIEDQLSRQEISRILMPPPKTPQSSRREEVPSSQSPIDTPPSTRTHRSTRDLSRSPLKGKSTNIRRTAMPLGKNESRARTLEVADSMDYKYGDDGLTPSTLSIPIPIHLKLKEPVGSVSDFAKESTAYNSSHEVLASERSLNADTNRPKNHTRIMKTEVSDTDADDDDDDEDDELAVRVSDIQNKPVPQMTNADSTSNLFLDTDDPTPLKSAQPPTNSSESPSTSPPPPPPPLTKNTTQPTLPKSNTPSAQPQSPTNPCIPPHPLSSPTTTTSFPSHSPSSSPSPSPSPSPKTPPIHPSTTTTNLPTQTPPPPSPPSTKLPPFLPPTNPSPTLPPSQATTTDLTQPPSSSLRLLHPHEGSNTADDNDDDDDDHLHQLGMGMGLGSWDDGLRLRDSQLLPDSILNDGLGGEGIEGWESEEEY